MKSKRLLVIFLVALIINSCSTFKPLPAKRYLIYGIFSADYRGSTYNGFFSLNSKRLKFDFINSIGLAVAGVSIDKKGVLIKNYQNGIVYKNPKIGNLNFKTYQPLFLYIADNFLNLCKKTNKNLIILRCRQVNNFKVPTNFILINKNNRLKIILSNIKIKSEGGMR